MGVFDFFRNRRERESALAPFEPPAAPSEALGSFASPESQPVVGQQLGGGQRGSIDLQGIEGLAALAQLGPMIQRAIAEGQVQIEHGPSQTIDMRGTGLREEILGIMGQHGVDAEAGTAQSVDAAAYGDMQRQIIDALAKHGIDPGAGGVNFQVSPEKD